MSQRELRDPLLTCRFETRKEKFISDRQRGMTWQQRVDQTHAWLSSVNDSD